MLLGGGLEETGWRYILQPEMEKKYSFVLSTLFMSIIWWFWHSPLFFIAGTAQSTNNFYIFGIGILAFDFALSTIKKVSNSVLLCILFHSLTNSLMNIYILNSHAIGYILSTAILICLSFLVLIIQKKYLLFK